MGMKVLSEAVDHAQFTDGSGASGTLKLTRKLPKGAIFLYSKVQVVEAFLGDTSAVLLIGDGSDADRYNTGTPSVFTLAADGVEMGPPGGNRFHAAVQEITLTVTGGSDWGAITAGKLKLKLYYIATQ